MNEDLRKYILSLNCSIINPILAKLGSKEVVGWYCTSTSILRKEKHLKGIEKLIKEKNIDCYVSEIEKNKNEFIIYIN